MTAQLILIIFFSIAIVVLVILKWWMDAPVIEGDKDNNL